MSRFLKISAALAGSFILSATAFAQSTIEEVIVTAQRTEQSLQSVPIAVSAFTAEALEERQIEVSSDLQLQVPGITFSASTFSGGGGFSIRGITNFATAASADAGVEIHMNGMPLGTTSANEVGFLDMARIEVLRGPQGTLFGQNSTGGAVNVISKAPSTEGDSGKLNVTFGDYDLKKFGDADLMRKVFKSRFSKDDKILPDLIIIDGGQPYLKICQEIIDDSGISESIKLIGVSKGFKRDFRFDRYHTLSEKNLSLKDSPQIEGFIQKMRDQAHKLSKKNSMKRMSDSLKTSFLDDISGIGKIKKMRVINFFGSVQNLKKANKDELTQIKGLNSKNIKAILDKING